MSVEQVEAFYKKVREDADFKEKVMAITEDVPNKVVTFAREAGFDVTQEDFMAMFQQEGAISDDVVAAVAGGKCKPGGCVEICGNFIGHLDGRS